MAYLFNLLVLFWMAEAAKTVLFYLYLWQLKEYHLGRFLDHFRTEKGKRLIRGRARIIKYFIFILFFCFLLSSSGYLGREPVLKTIVFILTLVYFVQALNFLGNIIKKNIKKPVLTKKTGLLTAGGLLAELLGLGAVLYFSGDIFLKIFLLLLLDVILPLVLSLIVLFFQVPTVIIRNQIIKKATKKILQHPSLITIGITGSYGKTSTKEFLAEILSEKFNVFKTQKHQNSEMGISQCVLSDLGPEHEVFVTEMGAYNKGGVKLLCGIVKPKIGIITGVNQQHLALFGSMGNLLSAEGGRELIDSLPKDGLIIFNGQNPYCQDLYKSADLAKKLCSREKLLQKPMLQSDIWAENIKSGADFVSFTAKTKEGESADFKVKVLGEHNILNLLMAAAAAQKLGVTLKEASLACGKIKPEQGAMVLIPGKEGINIIDASYSANPDGVIADLEYLKKFPAKKKIIVMPCLIELGPASEQIHKTIGEKIGEVCDLAIITTKDRFESIKEACLKAERLTKQNIVFLEEPDQILERINIFSSPGDAVLFEGRVSKRLIADLKT